MEPRCVVDCANVLGEGPVWSVSDQALYWVDINGKCFQRYDPLTEHYERRALPMRATALTPKKSGGFLLATENGLADYDPASGSLDVFLDPEPDRPDNRSNDGKCDPQGRFWIGTMDNNVKPGQGALYRYDGDECVRMLDGIDIANTLAWGPEGVFYTADSLAKTIYAFDFDADKGAITNQRIFAEMTDAAFGPDGSCIDAQGYLWNAQWDGWRIVRYAPDGSIDRIVDMPVQRPTSCMFGGADLATLFVTSASEGLSASEQADQPQAGGLFALDVGVCGVPEVPFAG